MKNNIVRSSALRITRRPFCSSTRGIALIGSVCTMSTSPESSAALRVAGLAIGVKITSVRLCSGLSHQVGFGTITILPSAPRLLRMNGPVPIAFIVEYDTSFFVRSVALAVLFFSDHAFDMISHDDICCGKVGFGPAIANSTVWSSIFLMPVLPRSTVPSSEPGPFVRP